MIGRIRTLLTKETSWFTVAMGGTYLLAFLILDYAAGFSESLPNVHSWYPPAGLTFALVLAGDRPMPFSWQRL